MATQSYVTFKVNGVNISYQTGEISFNQGSGATLLASLSTSLYSVYNAGITASQLENNLYAVFNGDGDATDMISNRSGNPVNGATYTTGKIGQAFSFDGVNDYISLPNNTLNLTGDFSISFWYYTNVIGVEKSIISNYNSNTTGGNPNGTGFIVASSTSNQIGIAIYNAGFATCYSSSNTLAINTWYHVTITRKSGTRTRVYVNASLAQSDTSTKDPIYPQATYTAAIGQQPGAGGYVNGRIDGLSFWTKELIQSEITTLYNSGNGLQYPFTKDSVINSPKNQFGVENGVLMNGATYGTGKLGNAFSFDGVNDYVALPNNSLSFTGSFSYSAFIKYNNFSAGENHIISAVNGNGTSANFGNYFGFYQGQLFLGVANNTSISAWRVNGSLVANAWYHVVVTKTPSTAPKFYINGVLQTTTLFAGTNTLNPAYTSVTYPNSLCSIGAYLYNNGSSSYAYSNGLIDAMSIWTKELTQEEVTNLYNSGNGFELSMSSIVTDNLLFNLDAARSASYAGSGTTIFDNSGNANNATIMPTVITPGAIGTNGATYKSIGIPRFIFNYTADGSYGSNSYAKIPLSTTTDANGYTFGGWVQCLSSGGATFHKGADGIYGGWALYLSFSPTGVGLAIINASSQQVSLSGATTSTAGQWYYITGQYIHGSGLKVYKNGQLINSMTQGATAISLRNSPGWTIAATATTSIGQCVVSTYHAYNRVLTSAEILQNFDNTKSNYGY